MTTTRFLCARASFEPKERRCRVVDASGNTESCSCARDGAAYRRTEHGVCVELVPGGGWLRTQGRAVSRASRLSRMGDRVSAAIEDRDPDALARRLRRYAAEAERQMAAVMEGTPQ